MGTSNYPDLHLIEKPIMVNSAWRIIAKKYQNDPLGMGAGSGQFSSSDGEFKLLYAASKLQSAIRETLVRFTFDNNNIRQIPKFKIQRLVATMLNSIDRFILLALTGGGATNVGIPSVVRQSKYYARSRRLSLEVYNEMRHIDGFFYLSRLDDNVCFAIFDRAVSKEIVVVQTDALTNVPEFQVAIKELRISKIKVPRRK